jgi:hypothetical protein
MDDEIDNCILHDNTNHFVSLLTRGSYIGALEHWAKNVDLIDVRGDERYEAGYVQSCVLYPEALEIVMALGARPTVARDHFGNTALEYYKEKFPNATPDSPRYALLEAGAPSCDPVETLYVLAKNEAGYSVKSAFEAANSITDLDDSLQSQRELWTRLAACKTKLPELRASLDAQMISRVVSERRKAALAAVDPDRYALPSDPEARKTSHNPSAGFSRPGNKRG